MSVPEGYLQAPCLQRDVKNGIKSAKKQFSHSYPDVANIQPPKIKIIYDCISAGVKKRRVVLSLIWFLSTLMPQK